MGKFFYFILCGLIFCFALNILYFMKKHLKNGESKIFSIDRKSTRLNSSHNKNIFDMFDDIFIIYDFIYLCNMLCNK